MAAGVELEQHQRTRTPEVALEGGRELGPGRAVDETLGVQAGRGHAPACWAAAHSSRVAMCSTSSSRSSGSSSTTGDVDAVDGTVEREDVDLTGGVLAERHQGRALGVEVRSSMVWPPSARSARICPVQ